MARAEWCGGYEATRIWADKCLISNGSLFSPDPNREVWSPENLDALKERFDEAKQEKGKTFVEQLLDQIKGASPDQIQLAAEAFFMQQLGEGDIGGEKKTENIAAVLAASPETDPISAELEPAVSERGVSTYGAQKSNRSAFVSLVIQVAIDLKENDQAEVERILQSPMDFLKLVRAAQTSNDGMQANALLHLLFPDDFEYMISSRQQDQLVKAFSSMPGLTQFGDSKEAKIHAIRLASDQTLGREMELYERPMFPIWSNGSTARWNETVEWGERFFEDSKFDEHERDYKLSLGSKLEEARTALKNGSDEWIQKLVSAFRSSENNLVHHIQGLKFTDWCEANPEAAASLLGELWEGENLWEELEPFLNSVPPEASSGPGMKLSLATFLLLASAPEHFPYYKRTLHTKFRELVGVGNVDSAPVEDDEPENPPVEVITSEKSEERGVEIELYEDWTLLLEELRLRLLAQGCELRDLLDAQGIVYCLLEGEVPTGWTPEQVKSFGYFREPSQSEVPDALEEPPVETKPAKLPKASSELASKTFLPQNWLQAEILDLLEDKRQVIFYGPPGTGKTFVAQTIGDLVKEAGGEARLVQFHPSYTYEDFFEGYRPTGATNESIQFQLVPGPLREMADEARSNPSRPFLLIVDEINRGNVAKVFGELFFLLEYRNQEIELQYSQDGQQFSIPDNLFIIGTMNTADRSIALVDTAMRRRFYFVGFDPQDEPVKSVLLNWLERNDLETQPALLLNALNEKIDDRDFSIGPSYLMTGDGTDPDLDRAWKHSIKPLLEEHFYGSGRDVESEFGFNALGASLAAEADSEPLADAPAD